MIHEWAKANVEPYDPECVNPASLDLKLSNYFICLGNSIKTKSNSIVIEPGTAYLATTLEYIKMPSNAAGVVYLKSSLARRGLDHALAGWIDPGFCGELTMELHAHRPITLHAGQRIIQLVLYKTIDTPAKLYDGKYQDQRGPTEAR
jgi:dCTP deaminase